MLPTATFLFQRRALQQQPSRHPHPAGFLLHDRRECAHSSGAWALNESWEGSGGGCHRPGQFTGSPVPPPPPPHPRHRLSPLPSSSRLSSSASRNLFLTINPRGWEDREGEGCPICDLQPGAETGQAPSWALRWKQRHGRVSLPRWSSCCEG